jgi:hypothetical protein
VLPDKELYTSNFEKKILIILLGVQRVDFDGGMKKAGSMKCKIRIQKKKMIGE